MITYFLINPYTILILQLMEGNDFHLSGSQQIFTAFLFCVVDLLSGISLKETCRMADGITFRTGHSNWVELFDVIDLL